MIILRFISIDKDGNKWIGCDNGLLKYDNKKWTVYNIDNSALPDIGVCSIAIDKYGNKWIGTTKGLAVFNEDGIISKQ